MGKSSGESLPSFAALCHFSIILDLVKFLDIIVAHCNHFLFSIIIFHLIVFLYIVSSILSLTLGSDGSVYGQCGGEENGIGEEKVARF